MKTFLILLFLASSLSCFAQQESSFKLFRFGNKGEEKPAVLTSDGKKLDVSAYCVDYNEEFFKKGGIEGLENWLKENADKCPSVPSDVRLGSPIARPSKIIAIGLNYKKHVQESGMETPEEPVVFLKATSSLIGPYDEVLMPPNSVKSDYEAELAIVIGKEASRVPVSEASEYIAGFTIFNDYTEREWQLEGNAGQWDKGKSPDTFGPLGPYLVSSKGIGDPDNLKIWLKVNGELRQESNTNEMIFNVGNLVSEVSDYMTLFPGDVIATGTPSGVGMGGNPPQYLSIGDEIELGIENLGTQKQQIGTVIKYYLTDSEYQDFQDWVSIGVGGLPHTLDGYRLLKKLGDQMSGPLDMNVFSDKIGKGKDIKTLSKLPKRKGARPTIAPFAIPHRQVNQNNSNSIREKQKTLFDQVVAKHAGIVEFKTSYYEKHNQSIYLIDINSGNPDIMEITHAEIAHMHPSDGSVHATVSPSDAREIIEKGWGELHGLSGQIFKGEDGLPSTYMMIYAPRNDAELEIIQKILEAAIKYSSNQ